MLNSATPANVNSIPFIFLETNFNARGSIITSNTLRTFSSGVILKIPITQDFGDMQGSGKGANTALGSRERGIYAGGQIPSNVNQIEFITFASTGNGDEHEGNTDETQ